MLVSSKKCPYVVYSCIVYRIISCTVYNWKYVFIVRWNHADSWNCLWMIYQRTRPFNWFCSCLQWNSYKAAYLFLYVHPQTTIAEVEPILCLFFTCMPLYYEGHPYACMRVCLSEDNWQTHGWVSTRLVRHGQGRVVTLWKWFMDRGEWWPSRSDSWTGTSGDPLEVIHGQGRVVTL